MDYLFVIPNIIVVYMYNLIEYVWIVWEIRLLDVWESRLCLLDVWESLIIIFTQKVNYLFVILNMVVDHNLVQFMDLYFLFVDSTSLHHNPSFNNELVI